jgi:hypothetical protein
MTGKIGRPKAEIDHELIEDLAAIGCTLGRDGWRTSRRQIDNQGPAAADPEFAEAIERGRARGQDNSTAPSMATSRGRQSDHAHMARKTATPARGMSPVPRVLWRWHCR